MRLTRRAFVGLASAGALTGVGGGVLGWRSGTAMPEVREHTVRFKSLPAGIDGIRLALVSDVHAGAHMDEPRMRRIVRLVNSLQTDLVFLAGDLIDGSGSASDVEGFQRAFSGLQSAHGVIAVPGNHDHVAGVERIGRTLREVDIAFLRGDHRVVGRGGGTLILLGLDDPTDRSFDPPQDEAVARVCARAPAEGVRILLSHRPRAFDAAASHGIPLTLAGHTHGGQIGLPWRGATVVRPLTPYVRGTYQKDGCHLIVSAGVGTGVLPLRVGVPPSVEMVTLRGGFDR